MKYLKIFTDFLDVVEPLSDEERGRLFMAMLGYALDGREPQLTGNERFLWTVAKQHINREVAAYMTKVEADRKNGKKGAAIRWQKVAKDGDPHSEIGENSQDNDNEKNNDKNKNNDDDKYIYMGGKPPEAPAPKAHIYIQPPSLEEIRSFCQERGNSVDPQYFYNYYQSNGWRVGKNPMRDWKAAVCAWESNGMAEKMAPAKKPDFLDSFRGAMELLNMEEAKEV